MSPLNETSISVSGAVLSAPRVRVPAAAQNQPDLERARNSFRAGLSLEAAGSLGPALKFEDLARVELAPRVRFQIAGCLLKTHFVELADAACMVTQPALETVTPTHPITVCCE